MIDLDFEWEMTSCRKCTNARHKISPDTGTFYSDEELEMLHTLWHRDHPLIPTGGQL